jgi:MerR family redox-sensitive transcriptional activator SoxR
MTIGELANETGIAPSAIRYYERRGLLEPPERVSGRRVYDDGAIEALTAIRVAKEAGFSLDEIERLFRGFDAQATPSARWRALADGKLAELDRRAAEIEHMRALLRRGLVCGCITLEDCSLVRAHRGRG